MVFACSCSQDIRHSVASGLLLSTTVKGDRMVDLIHKYLIFQRKISFNQLLTSCFWQVFC